MYKECKIRYFDGNHGFTDNITREAEYKIKEYGPFVQDWLLDAFEKFLCKHGEGALAVLLLLDSAWDPKKWLAGMPFRSVGIGSSRCDPYPGYNTLYVPRLTNREPLLIMQTQEKLGKLLSGVNVEADCAKYYWVADYKNPYAEYEIAAKIGGWDEEERRKRLEGILVRRCECIEKMFNRRDGEIRSDFQLLLNERRRRWEWFRQEIIKTGNGKDWWMECGDLVRTYLDLRACDIVSFGEKIGNKTFPQPSIPGLTSNQVADAVNIMVTLLQDYNKERKRQEYEEWRTGKKQEIEERFDSLRRQGLQPRGNSVTIRRRPSSARRFDVA